MVWRATIDHGDGEAVDHGGDLGAGREAEDSTQGCRVRGSRTLKKREEGKQQTEARGEEFQERPEDGFRELPSSPSVSK